MTSSEPCQTSTAGLLADLVRVRRTSGDRLATPPAGSAPPDLDSAYALAASLVAALGQPIAGWKIGASAPAGQRFLGLEEPFWGAILESEVLKAPALIPPIGAPFEVEPEIVMRLARDLRARPDRDTAAAAIDQVAWGLEINRPSFAAPFEAGGLCLVADKGVTRGLVVGAPIPDWRQRDLGRLPGQLVVDGDLGPEVTAMDAGFDPLDALVWLAGDKARRGDPLRAGQWIATGALGRARPLAAGQTATVLAGGEAVAHLAIAG